MRQREQETLSGLWAPYLLRNIYIWSSKVVQGVQTNKQNKNNNKIIRQFS